jgi:NitT/TauT family transport system permease protein
VTAIHAHVHRSSRAVPTWARAIVYTVLPPVILAVLGVAAWWLGADAAQSTVFPTPPQSMRSLFSNLGSAEFRSSLFSSLKLLAESYLAAVLIGGLLGVTIGLSRFVADAVSPLLYALNSIPKIVVYPLFLIFLGIGDTSRFSFAFVTGLLPMLLMALDGATAVQRVHLKLAASVGLGYPALLRKIVLPSLVPALATGARLTFGLTFLGLLLAEMFSGSGGLGYELLRNVSLVRLQDIVGEVVLVGVIALIPTILLRWAENRLRARFGS